MGILKFIGKSLISLLLFLVAFFVVTYFAFTPEFQIPETVEYDKSLPVLQIDSTIFHSEHFGRTGDSVVIVLHGGPGGDYKNLLNLKALADSGYYVVFYDQMGSGLSPRVQPEEITLENSIKDLDMIVDHYRNEGKLFLIGHSWGGMLATAYMAKYPEKVEKAVLAEPGFLTPELGNEFMKKTNDLNPGSSIGNMWTMYKIFIEAIHVKQPDDFAWMDYLQLRMMTIKNAKDHPIAGYFCDQEIPEALSDVWRMGSLANQQIMLNGMEDGKFVVDLSKGIEDYEGEVLLLASECNTIIGRDVQEEHLKYFNYAELKIIPDTGHLMFAHKPDTCLTLITEFFRDKP